MAKKKSGFTLVELLATIAILAIIMLVATGSVMGIMNKVREKSALEMRENLKDVALTHSLKDIHLSKCSASFSLEMENGDIAHLNDPSNASCIKKLQVGDLIDAGIFEDPRGYCNRGDVVVIYRYSVGELSEYKAFLSDLTCK